MEKFNVGNWADNWSGYLGQGWWDGATFYWQGQHQGRHGQKGSKESLSFTAPCEIDGAKFFSNRDTETIKTLPEGLNPFDYFSKRFVVKQLGTPRMDGRKIIYEYQGHVLQYDLDAEYVNERYSWLKTY